MKHLFIILTLTVVLTALGGTFWFTSACPARQPSAHLTAASPATPEAASAEPFQIITAEEAKAMMDAGDVTIVDVRRQNEYDAGHVKGAILVPNESISDTAPEALPDKEATLLVYCRTGIRAKDAAGKLAALGYQNVYDFGGIVDWPYETEQ